METIGQSPADKFITLILYVSGLWFAKNPSLLYRIYSNVLLFLMVLPWVICAVAGLVLTDNLSKATHAICTSLPIAVFFAKAMNVYVHNGRIQSCLKRVHNFKLVDDDEKKFVNNTLSIFFKLTVFFTASVVLTISMVCFRALFIIKPELAFTAWYPLDWQHNNLDFWIAHSYQSYLMIIVGFINSACELFPCFFLTMIGCQLDLLGMRLKKLNEDCTEEISEERNNMVDKLIDQNVKTHHYILQLTKDIQKCYDFPYFLDICTVGLNITAILFQLAFLVAKSKLGDHDISEYLHYITYFVCTVIRVFMPCYFGNLILTASGTLPLRLYSSGWLDMPTLCRKKLIILMERMKRPTNILAWVLFPLTLETFQSIMNFSYTMLTLLQNVN